MQAVVLRAFGGPLALEERAVPVARTPDEVVVRVLACGVCHSDLHVAEGHWPGLPLPRVLGHEITGIVEGVGNVLVYAPWGCGSCRHCAVGDEQICPDVAEAGIGNDGGYAEHVLVPSRRFIFPLGDLDPVRAAPLACGGLTPYRAVKRRHDLLRAGSTAVVIGAGGLGQFGIQYLRILTDAHVIVADPSPEKQRRALELGAHEACAPDELDGRVDAVFDFVGADATLAQAVKLVHQGGAVVAMGLWGGSVPFGVGRVPHEATLASSIWGSLEELREVIAIAGRGDLAWEVETLPLAEAATAHARLRSGDVSGRLVLVP